MAGFAPETKSKCKILKIRHKFKNQNFENVSHTSLEIVGRVTPKF